MPGDRCEPPPGTAPGTECLLQIGDDAATVTNWWWHDQEWRSSPNGPWIGGFTPCEMEDCGWRFVRVAEAPDAE